MLYQTQRNTNTFHLIRYTAGFIAGLAALLRKEHADNAYLDGMRECELEDLGLRRSSDGSYQPFK